MSESHATPAATEPRAYRFWSVEHVRFADLDMLGHVNNVAFTVYAESGRAAFLREAGLWKAGSARHNVVARLEMDYRRELQYPGEVRLGLRVLKIGNSSFTVGQGFFSGETCAATAVATLVRFDAHTRRAVPLDENERRILQAHLVVDAD